jgi:hypothetical protein
MKNPALAGFFYERLIILCRYKVNVYFLKSYIAGKLVKKLRTMIMRIISSLILLLTYNAFAYSATEIDASFSILSSSEPVSIDDMINGWDGDYQPGELAYANLVWDIGFAKSIEVDDTPLGTVRVSRGYRIYYYLKFDEETADYFRATEQGTDIGGDKTLDLEVKSFEAPSVSLSYHSPFLELPVLQGNYQLELSSHLYQPGHFQFGEVKGIAYGPGTDDFSATIDYRYDQFKLPLLEEEQGYDVEKGFGFSFDLGLTLDFDSWLAKVEASDLLAQFYWEDAGVTKGCLQTSAGEGAVCETTGGNGTSEQKSTVETIPVSYSGLLKSKNLDLSLHAYQHDTYYRLGVEKGQQTALGRLGFFLYYPRLVGMSWHTSIFNVQLGADTFNFNQAHNIQLSMGANWQW